MTQARLRAIWSLTVWGIAAAGFVAAFVSGGGPEGFAGDGTRPVVTAAIVAAGFFAYALMLWRTRAGGQRPVPSDERDEHIARRANGIALVSSLIYVFLFCIALYEGYHDRQQVPVGWMWFLAYSTAFAAYLGHAIATLVLDSGAGSRAEG